MSPETKLRKSGKGSTSSSAKKQNENKRVKIKHPNKNYVLRAIHRLTNLPIKHKYVKGRCANCEVGAAIAILRERNK